VRVRRPSFASHTNAVEAVAPKVKPAEAPPSARNTAVYNTPVVNVVGSAVGAEASASQPSEVSLSAQSRPKNTATALTLGGSARSACAGTVAGVGLNRDSAPPAVHITSPFEAAPLAGAPLGPEAEAVVSSRPAAVRRANTRGTGTAEELESAPFVAPPSGAS
jgi:hypothetical protein